MTYVKQISAIKHMDWDWIGFRKFDPCPTLRSSDWVGLTYRQQ